ncbi:MAG: RNA polymerase sigma factor [Deltaproteobacteria bacterium]|nr:RNA polymerase sigma factor [Deltaproteobacteria bacterium]
MTRPDTQNEARPEGGGPPAPLVEAARAGDRHAFSELMGPLQGEIFRMVYYRTRSRMDAEDITQDVFFQAFKKLPGLHDAGRFRPWVFSIALNRVRDFHRRRRFTGLFGRFAEGEETERNEAGSSAGNDPLEAAARKEFWNTIGSFLDRLSRGEREVFLLRFFDQLTLSEIARVLKKSKSTVKTHLYRALSKLRNEKQIFKILEEQW